MLLEPKWEELLLFLGWRGQGEELCPAPEEAGQGTGFVSLELTGRQEGL